MEDVADKFMAVWLSFPESNEPLVVQAIKDDEGQFDINQPKQRGIAKTNTGIEIPFFCWSVVIMVPSPNEPKKLDLILNVFRINEVWMATLNPGFRPCFNPSHGNPITFDSLTNLLKASNEASVGCTYTLEN